MLAVVVLDAHTLERMKVVLLESLADGEKLLKVQIWLLNGMTLEGPRDASAVQTLYLWLQA